MRADVAVKVLFCITCDDDSTCLEYEEWEVCAFSFLLGETAIAVLVSPFSCFSSLDDDDDDGNREEAEED
eukprot:3255939-Ditylum_brightwellii.AAC.1